MPAFQAITNGTTLTAAFTASGIWADYWQSLALSYGLGAIVTVLGILTGIPIAILIARKTFANYLSILDILINIPLIVTINRLGISLKFFWQGFTGMPEFMLLIFAHHAITYHTLSVNVTAKERINIT